MTTRGRHGTGLRGAGLYTLVVGLAVVLGSGPALADGEEEAFDPGWSLRFYAAAIDFDQSSPAVHQGGFDVEMGGGVGVNGEYRFTRHLGVDLGFLAGGGVDLVATTVQAGHQTWLTYDTVGFTPLTAGLGIHLTPEARVDVSICPFLAWIRYGSLSVASGPPTFTSRVDFDNDFAAGAALGLGVPFGQKRWSFEAAVTYIDSSMSGRGTHGVRVSEDYDMTSFGVGVGYRF